MKKLFLLLSMSTAAVAAAPSIGFAKLVLDLPPILAAKTTSSGCTTNEQCGTGQYCCNGTCQATACPATCTDNTGCGDSTPNCCNGTCQATACPATCTDNTGCGGSTPNCCNGTCQATACPATCTDNTGCGGSTPNCCNGTCQTATCGTVPTPSLNDTGITSKVGTSGQEDADFGRDKTHNNNADGHAGFSFTKLDSKGAVLPADASSWACVQDNVTRLIWEHKTDPPSRSWYNNNNSTNGGNAGAANGIFNTQSYAASANTDKLCGQSTGWRVPTIKELVSLINSSKKTMAADQNYFLGINTSNKFFWSSTPSVADPSQAWGVDFEIGLADRNYAKAELNAISIMLVRTMD